MGKTYNKIKGIVVAQSKGANLRKYNEKWRRNELIGCRCSYCVSGKGHKYRKQNVADLDQLNDNNIERRFINIDIGKFYD